MKKLNRLFYKKLLCVLGILSVSTMSLAQNAFTPFGLDGYKGYLTAEDIPDTISIFASPPEFGSPEFLVDVNAYLQAREMMGSERWDTAIKDADLSTDAAIGRIFSSALGVNISAETTPETIKLLRAIQIDVGITGINALKKHYQRVRPYAYFNLASCRPDDDEHLSKSGAYPSGHSAVGWTAALVFAGMFPEKKDAILKRGYEYGDSRYICGAHWKSDIDAARVLGSTIYPAITINKDYQEQSARSKQELERLMNEK